MCRCTFVGWSLVLGQPHGVCEKLVWCSTCQSLCQLRPVWILSGTSRPVFTVSAYAGSTYVMQVAAVLCRHQCVQNLDLSGLKSGLDDKALFERIAPCLQQLRELHFSHTAGSGHRVSDKVISIIAESLPSLRLLDLQGVSMQATAGPYHCTLDHTGLETLRLTGCESYGMTLRCRSLRRLSLADSPLMRLPDLTGCPALVELDVRGCKKMQDMTVRNALPGLVNLRTLHLGKGVPLTDETLREVNGRRVHCKRHLYAMLPCVAVNDPFVTALACRLPTWHYWNKLCAQLPKKKLEAAVNP